MNLEANNAHDIYHLPLCCLHGYHLPLPSVHPVLWCFVRVCFVQVTILRLVLRSQCADLPRCAHFPTDICSVIQEGEITVEKCGHWGASARREFHTLSLGRNKHVHNNSAPSIPLVFFLFSSPWRWLFLQSFLNRDGWLGARLMNWCWENSRA